MASVHTIHGQSVSEHDFDAVRKQPAIRKQSAVGWVGFCTARSGVVEDAASGKRSFSAAPRRQHQHPRLSWDSAAAADVDAAERRAVVCEHPAPSRWRPNAAERLVWWWAGCAQHAPGVAVAPVRPLGTGERVLRSQQRASAMDDHLLHCLDYADSGSRGLAKGQR